MEKSIFDRVLNLIGIKTECDEEDLGMKLIVGLGNPGTEYVGTRHNVGFEVIDRICEEYQISLNKEKFKGVYGQGIIGSEKVLVAKPMTYMNLSGECVGEMARFYKIEPQDVIVISDDINLDVGNIRIREKGSAGGHNGLKDIILHLGSEEFPRVRVGVGMKKAGSDLAKHVLGRFEKDQLEMVAETMDRAVKAVALIVEGDPKKAMNLYNGAAKK